MSSNSSFQKRQKERARLDKQREKEERKKQRREERPTRTTGDGGVDPDIAHIVPGPQPVTETEDT